MKTFFLYCMCLFFFGVGCRSAAAYSGAKDCIDYRTEMRRFVTALAEKARRTNPAFAVIPQNGQELVEKTENSVDTERYLRTVSGTGREDLYFGYTADDAATPENISAYMKSLCDVFASYGKNVLVIDYCSTPASVDFSYAENYTNGYLSFAADNRNLSSIPVYPAEPFRANADAVLHIDEAHNFLYLINPENFSSKEDFIRTLAATGYDMLIIDLFYAGKALDSRDVRLLQYKPNGARRQVIAYMSIGEAESYRYYWKKDWKYRKPQWLKKENPHWKENYKVAYWHPEWQNIIFAGEDSYLQKILDAGFDGVYLDIIDAFEYFENGEKE